MALNTRDRRSAAILPCLPFRAALPLPADGITTMGQLRHLAYLARMGNSDTDTLPVRVLIYGSALCVTAAVGESIVLPTIVGDRETL